MKNNICCIFNLAPHYRSPIYEIMDKELSCDFYFGDDVGTPIKTMDYSILKGFKSIIKNRRLRFPKGWRWQDSAWKLIFKPYKYYIITGSPGCLSNWVILLLALPLRKKVFAWSHGMRGNYSTKKRLLEKYFYRLCDKVLLYGEFSKDIMIKEGFKEDKLIPIYNSLDYEKQLQVRKNLISNNIYKDYFGNDNPVLIYIGRIQKSKKITMLVEALKLLKERNQECNLTIIGPNIEENNLSSLVMNYGLSKNVWFYGPSYQEEEIGNLVHNADVCISPGSVGLTALHCMTYGTPVISHNNFHIQMPEFEVITDGINGAFYKEDDMEDLYSKIENWINLNDKDRNRVRKKAYDVIDNKYNPNYQIKVLKNLLNK